MRPHLQVITVIAAIASRLYWRPNWCIRLRSTQSGGRQHLRNDRKRRLGRPVDTNTAAERRAARTHLSWPHRFSGPPAGGCTKPELADKLSTDQALQDLPQGLTEEIPVLHAHRFVKLDDRILLVDPSSRVVVAMIPRYRVLQ